MAIRLAISLASACNSTCSRAVDENTTEGTVSPMTGQTSLITSRIVLRAGRLWIGPPVVTRMGSGIGLVLRRYFVRRADQRCVARIALRRHAGLHLDPFLDVGVFPILERRRRRIDNWRRRIAGFLESIELSAEIGDFGRLLRYHGGVRCGVEI